MSAALTSPVSAARRLPAAPIFALLLVLGVLPARALSGAGADALGDRIAGGLLRALGPVSAALVPADLGPPLELVSTASAGWSSVASAGKSAHGVKRGPKPSLPHAIRISAAQVLALAARRAMPAATPVRANQNHPAGLQLLGVSALGVGLQDGDVLTEAAGQKASSVATVVGIVLAARARHSSEISGRFNRAGVRYTLTVEQPYPPST